MPLFVSAEATQVRLHAHFLPVDSYAADLYAAFGRPECIVMHLGGGGKWLKCSVLEGVSRARENGLATGVRV